MKSVVVYLALSALFEVALATTSGIFPRKFPVLDILTCNHSERIQFVADLSQILDICPSRTRRTVTQTVTVTITPSFGFGRAPTSPVNTSTSLDEYFLTLSQHGIRTGFVQEPATSTGESVVWFTHIIFSFCKFFKCKYFAVNTAWHSNGGFTNSTTYTNYWKYLTQSCCYAVSYRAFKGHPCRWYFKV